MLAGVVSGTGVETRADVPNAKVLDVGTGTGALASRLTALGCRVLGVDLSEHMLDRARQNVPTADFQQLDLLGDWGDLETLRFDAVVSAYVFHEFDAETKRNLLSRFVKLLKPGGRVLIGDISFQTAASRDAAYRRWQNVWDEREHYWVAGDALPKLQNAGFHVVYRQVSFCAGVYILQSRTQ